MGDRTDEFLRGSNDARKLVKELREEQARIYALCPHAAKTLTHSRGDGSWKFTERPETGCVVGPNDYKFYFDEVTVPNVKSETLDIPLLRNFLQYKGFDSCTGYMENGIRKFSTSALKDYLNSLPLDEGSQAEGSDLEALQATIKEMQAQMQTQQEQLD